MEKNWNHGIRRIQTTTKEHKRTTYCSDICNENIRERLLHNVSSFRQVACNNNRSVIDVTEAKIVQLCTEVTSIRYSKVHLPLAG